MKIGRGGFVGALLLLALGLVLWRAHAGAWELGGRSPVLSFDAAQYALAAREVAEHGRLATPFALPVELQRHAAPPWPLAVVQPGLVLAEAAAFRLARPAHGGLADPARLEWLTLLLPLACYLALAVLLALAAADLLARATSPPPPGMRLAAGLTVGAAFLLDPEAQHFAVGGFTELPFTLGLCTALWLLARGSAARRPFVFGLLLGVTGTFRGVMLAFAPLFALAAARSETSRAGRVTGMVLAGCALVLAPWWLYKLRAFGSPTWDLSSVYAPWDGVRGFDWFSLSHRASEPVLPGGGEAFSLLAGKLLANVPKLLAAFWTGARGLETAALVAWLAFVRRPNPRSVAGGLIVALMVVALVLGALGAGWLRYLFPTRVPLEAAGLLAAWGLVASLPSARSAPRTATLLAGGSAALALAWAAAQTTHGLAEARATAAERGTPSTATLRALSAQAAAASAPDEVWMSNLGPSLAWYARRPVLHLAATPAEIAACRARIEFRHVLLAFRDGAHAWAGWRDAVDRPGSLVGTNEIVAERHETTPDGFVIVWLDCAPRRATGTP